MVLGFSPGDAAASRMSACYPSGLHWYFSFLGGDCSGRQKFGPNQALGDWPGKIYKYLSFITPFPLPQMKSLFSFSQGCFHLRSQFTLTFLKNHCSIKQLGARMLQPQLSSFSPSFRGSCLPSPLTEKRKLNFPLSASSSHDTEHLQRVIWFKANVFCSFSSNKSEFHLLGIYLICTLISWFKYLFVK